jgi:hypothetical protein
MTIQEQMLTDFMCRFHRQASLAGSVHDACLLFGESYQKTTSQLGARNA